MQKRSCFFQAALLLSAGRGCSDNGKGRCRTPEGCALRRLPWRAVRRTLIEAICKKPGGVTCPNSVLGRTTRATRGRNQICPPHEFKGKTSSGHANWTPQVSKRQGISPTHYVGSMLMNRERLQSNTQLNPCQTIDSRYGMFKGATPCSRPSGCR